MISIIFDGSSGYDFFFKKKTAYEVRISDWSSDVCSSDLAQALPLTPLDGIVAVVDEDVILTSELKRATDNFLAQFAGSQQQLPPRDVLERQTLDRLVLSRPIGRAHV